MRGLASSSTEARGQATASFCHQTSARQPRPGVLSSGWAGNPMACCCVRVWQGLTARGRAPDFAPCMAAVPGSRFRVFWYPFRDRGDHSGEQGRTYDV